ncbi:MAG: hypothetical protein KC468_38150 [Myxococcales bacterium]|nr:hypothetical protein [Myxococcales bacterium]
MTRPYLVAAGVPRPREDHAEALASLALEMHKAAVGVCSTSGTPVRLRVGINSGPLVAGVIGRTRLTYDLWGDTVNIAQRMELHGRPGETQITPLTFSKINHRYICKPREHVDVKGREPMKTYVIRGRRPT